jgi:MFS family permease
MSAFRYPDFRVLWASTVSNQLGLGMQQVLLGWLVFEITESGGMVGVVFAARSAPNLVVGFVAGSVSDRIDRRVLMRASVFGMVVCAGLVAMLLYLDRLEVWQLIVAAVYSPPVPRRTWWWVSLRVPYQTGSTGVC